MKIAVLTSSRADFGIYLPLLKKMKEDISIELEIIAFGTHVSHFHGYSLNTIKEEGFSVQHQMESLVLGDTEEAVATSIGLTVVKFSAFWAAHKDYHIVFCLGDRFEMLAAVIAGIPFNIRFAHIHGGETTLGAMDNVFRHAITHAAKLHFTATEEYAQIVKKMTGSQAVYNVGSLSLDNIHDIHLYSNDAFFEIWQIDLNAPTVLVTFHPETVNTTRNEQYAEELCDALQNLRPKYQIIITMPNADTHGSLIRGIMTRRLGAIDKVYLVENFGTRGYFTVMDRCSFLIGNTSSGIIEAASFNKYVINLGARQEGRLTGNNVFHTPVVSSEILKAVKSIEGQPDWRGGNIYSNGKSADKILQVIKGNGI